MKYRENIEQISLLKPDLIGFIFYPKSERFVGNHTKVPPLPTSIKKVGVFVNASQEEILNKVNLYNLDYVQLHGNETAKFCRELKQKHKLIIKAFLIESHKDIKQINAYENSCKLALLDTKVNNRYGGSGKSFDWNILNNYTSNLNFILSGGLGNYNIETALHLRHDKLIGFDLNSQLETKPGLKSIANTKKIIKKIREYERN